MKANFNLFFLVVLILFSFISSLNQYYLSNPVYSEDGSKFSGILTFTGEFNPSYYNYDWTRSSDLLTPINKLNIQISLECNQYLHFYVTDSVEKRWENPYSISDSFKERVKTCSSQTSQKSLSDFGLYISEDLEEPFYISLTNPSTGELIFTTEYTDFLFTDVFIGFGGYISTNDVYGFGERYHEIKLGDGKFTMWPNDTNGIHEDTGEGGYNAMGIHPLGFHKTSKNTFVGMLFNNINAQDLVITSYNSKKNEANDNEVLLEHRTIGGVIDYYLTINDTPDEALISLHDIIGHPTLPPFWSLGFHQCKWGYENTKEIRDVYESYRGSELPIDTFWGDIDILQDYRIFTLNMKNFYDLPSLIYEMHQNNYRFVPIVDLGFPKNDSDEFYVRGKEMNAFIKSNYTDDDLVSFVWPEKAVFPDFFNVEAESLWSFAMEKYYMNIKYDGIWLDMNEPAMIYVDDIERGEILPEGVVFDPKKNYYENIPYVPGYREDHPTIRGRTLSENCYSKLLPENKFLVSYNFKPLISLLETKLTNENLIKLEKRPFILSRSTSLGHGRYGFHWLGDNESTFKDMKNGVNGIFQFQIYGVPLTGDDICGFNGDSTDKLCARWMSLGAFFPFARNHNSLGREPQEPYAFGSNSLTFKSSKLALNMRYSLLRYYYTELFKVSLGEKGSFFKPIFFDYFSDENAYKNPGESFMVGKAIIIYPVFTDETKNIEVYLPKDDWNIFPTGENFRNKTQEGGLVSLSGEFNRINIFMRGGYIVPYQDTITKYIQNTHYLQKEKTELLIIPDSEAHLASGEVIFDNDNYDTLAKSNYYYIKMNFIYNTIFFENYQTMSDSYNNKDLYVSKLKFFRMKYLYEGGNYDMVRVKYRNGRISNVAVNILTEDKVEIDLSTLNIKFTEIDRIQFFKNN